MLFAGSKMYYGIIRIVFLSLHSWTLSDKGRFIAIDLIPVYDSIFSKIPFYC